MHNPLDTDLRDVGEVEEDVGEGGEEEEDRGGEREEEGVEVGFARGWGGQGADGRKDEVLCFWVSLCEGPIYGWRCYHGC